MWACFLLFRFKWIHIYIYTYAYYIQYILLQIYDFYFVHFFTGYCTQKFLAATSQFFPLPDRSQGVCQTPGPCRQVVWPKGPMECAAGVSWQRRHEGSWSQGWDMERDQWKGDINIDRMTSEKHSIIVGSPEYPDFDPYTVYTKVYILIVVSICCQTH